MSIRSLALTLVVALCALFGISASAAAAPGDLDPSFASGGILQKRYADDFGRFGSVLVQSDGKIVVGGYAHPEGASSGSDQLLARFNPDGSVDSSFGVGGYVLTDYATNEDDHVSDMALLGDGRILVGGSADWDSGDDSTLTLYLPNGGLDTTFSDDGKMRFDADLSGTDVDEVTDVVIAPNGKFIVAGNVLRGADFDVYVKRFNTDGTPDVTFNSGNTYFRHIGDDVSDSDDYTAGIAVRANGSMVVAARYQSSASTNDAALLGITTDGIGDSAFGAGVTATRMTASGSSNAYPVELIEQPDGKLVILSQDDSAGSTAISMTRWDGAATARDASFGTAGVLYVARGTVGLAAASMVGLADGSFLVGGYQYDPSTSSRDSLFFKATSGGAPDPTFGSAGIQLIDSGATTENVSDVAVQLDGKFLSVGSSSSVGSPLPAAAQAIRLLGNYVAPPVTSAPVPLTVKIKSPSKSKIKASKLKSIAGTATGTGLVKVQLAIQKLDPKLLKKSKRCRFVTGAKGKTKKYKASKSKKCAPTKYLTAKGTTNWSYKIKLKPGKYKLFLVGVGDGARVSKTTTKTFTLTK